MNHVGEVVCSSCGLVIEDTHISTETTNNNHYFSNGDRVYSELTSALIPGSYIKMDHSSRMLSISNVRVLGAQSTLLRGADLIKQTCRNLGLSRNIEKRAIFLLKTCLNEMRRRVNLTVSSAAGAAILFAVRENNIPIAFKEIYSSIRNKGKRATTSKMIRAYRIIEEIMGESPERMKPEVFVARVVNVLSNYFKTDSLQKQKIIAEIRSEASRYLASIPNQAISGKNPYVLASSVVYYVVFNKEKFRKHLTISSTTDYARVMHVTEYSLKENSKLFSHSSVSS